MLLFSKITEVIAGAVCFVQWTLDTYRLYLLLNWIYWKFTAN